PQDLPLQSRDTLSRTASRRVSRPVRLSHQGLKTCCPDHCLVHCLAIAEGVSAPRCTALGQRDAAISQVGSGQFPSLHGLTLQAPYLGFMSSIPRRPRELTFHL